MYTFRTTFPVLKNLFCNPQTDYDKSTIQLFIQRFSISDYQQLISMKVQILTLFIQFDYFIRIIIQISIMSDKQDQENRVPFNLEDDGRFCDNIPKNLPQESDCDEEDALLLHDMNKGSKDKNIKKHNAYNASYQIQPTNLVMTLAEVRSQLASIDGRHNQAIACFFGMLDDLSSTQILQFISPILKKTNYSSFRQLPLFIKYIWTISKIVEKLGKKSNPLNYFKIFMEILNRNCSFYQFLFSSDDILPKFQQICQENDSVRYWKLFINIYKGDTNSSQTNQNNPMSETIFKYIGCLVYENIIEPSLLQIENNPKDKVPLTILLGELPEQLLIDVKIQEYEKALLTMTKQEIRELPKADAENYCLSLISIVQIMENITNNKSLSEKYIYQLILNHLNEENSIERKLLGMKMLTEKVQKCKVKFDPVFLKWLKQSKAILKLLKDDTHVQILRKLPLIIRFLHQNGQLEEQVMAGIIEQGLVAHEELLKVVQSLITSLKIGELDEVFDVIRAHRALDSQNVVSMITSVVHSPALISSKHRKSKYKNQKRMNEQAQQQQDVEIQSQLEKLVIKLFTFLIKVVQTYQNIYIAPINKLISSQHKILMDYLPDELINLLRKSNICSIWILQHCLKMDLPKEKGATLSKYDFISKLASQGLYEYIFAMLARNRFNKSIVDKVINVLISLSRWYKPFEKYQIEFLWKVLGLKSHEEKQRQQFFLFLKQALRYDSLLTQQSVNYIYFEILMRQHFSWYSIRVYDCLQMLFMRLNEDCKQITYLTTNQQYQVQDADLIGLDKFWYIYFHCQDIKVVKKCKDFLCKLANYDSTVKNQLYQRFIEIIMHELSIENQTEDVLSRCFQIIQKIMNAKKEEAHPLANILQLTIQNKTKEALPPTRLFLKQSQTVTLVHLREQIGNSIHPPNKQIKLLCKGSELKGEKLTLKQLKIQNKNTIMVDNNLSTDEVQHRKKAMESNLTQLRQFFGMIYEDHILKYLAEKMEGQNIQRIMEVAMSQQQMTDIKKQAQNPPQSQQVEEQQLPYFGISQKNNQYKQLIQQDQQMQIPKQQIVLDFGKMLTINTKNLEIILMAAQKLNDPVLWQKIKKFPINLEIVEKVDKLTASQDWDSLFKDQSHPCKLLVLYYLHIISMQCKMSVDNKQQIMKKRKGYIFFTNWLKKLTLSIDNFIIVKTIVELLLINFNSEVLKLYDQTIQKQSNSNILNKIENIMELEQELVQEIPKEIIQNMQTILIDTSIKLSQAFSIFKYMLCYTIYATQHQNDLLPILSLDSTVIYQLLLKYGVASQYLILYSLSKTKDPDWQNFHKFLLSMIQFLGNTHKQSIAVNYLAYYDTVGNIINKIRKDILPEQFIKMVHELLKKINDHDINDSQLIGAFTLLSIICKESLPQEIQSDLTQLALWIYSSLLFGILKPHNHIRNKSVRRSAYSTLVALSRQSLLSKEMLMELIQGNEVGNKKLYEDYVDFRDTEFLGIRNLGATCYINSLLQQLYHTRLSLLLIDAEIQTEQQSQSFALKPLRKLFAELYLSNKNVVNAKPFIQSINFYGQPINPSIQQDSTQFLLCLLDHIEQKGGRKALEQVFGGTLCNQITGIEQQQPFVKYNSQHFFFISIDIKGKKNLHQGLAYFIKGQILENQNMFYSEELGRKTRAMKRTFFDKMPNILIFTLKRFEFDYENMLRQKLNDYFEFPMELDMHRYSATCLKNNQDQLQGFKYRLVGVLVHSGSAQSGHYYSFIKNGEKWFQFNDRLVSEFNVANLKNQCFGSTNDGRSRNAYMLFYQKNDSDMHGIFLNELPQENSLLNEVKKDNSSFLKHRLVFDEAYIEFLRQMIQAYDDEELKNILRKIIPAENNDKFKSNNQCMGVFSDDSKEKLLNESNEMNKAQLDIEMNEDRMQDFNDLNTSFGNNNNIINQYFDDDI